MFGKTTAGLAGALSFFCMATGQAAEIRALTENCETALALSAGPETLQKGAGVFVLGTAGYELARESENGFYCLVERTHFESVIPQCFDPASRAGNLAIILDEGKMLKSGTEFEDLRAWREKALTEGKYPPSSPGLVYMISNYNYIFNGENFIKAAPHVMYHAPFLKNVDIGANPREAFSNRGLPIINAEGVHGFMISFVEKTSPTKPVEDACQGQLPDPNLWQPFPPVGN